MLKKLIVVILVLLSQNAKSMGTPEKITLSPANLSQLGFSLTSEPDPSKSNLRLVYFKFPKQDAEGRAARRVQVILLDKNGNEVMGSSSDYGISSGGERPSVFAYYHPEDNDLMISVQYFCGSTKNEGCAEAYVIESVSDFIGAMGSD